MLISADGRWRGSAGKTNREYTFSSIILGPGQLFEVDKALIGSGVDPGDRLVLFMPGRSNVVDAVVAKREPRGRYPDGTGTWWFPTAPTPGASNHFVFNDALVINEIMHDSPPAQVGVAPPSWVEIFNRGSNPVDLTGWRLDEGIDFRFPVGKLLQPGGYVVVASDPALMQSIYSGLDVFGPFTNQLSKRSDNLVLKDPNNNVADEVRYFAGGPWPQYT